MLAGRRRALAALGLLLAALPLLPARTSGSEAPATAVLAGTGLTLPAIVFGRDDALVAVRPLAEAAGATVAWNGERREATILRDGRRLVLAVGRPLARADGSVVPLDVPSVLLDGRTLAPLRLVAGWLGLTVRWDAAARSFTVTGFPAPPSPAAPSPPPAAAPAPPSPGDPRRYLVLGYAPVDYPGDRSWAAALRDHGGTLDLVAYFGLRLLADGSLVNPTGGSSAELVEAARRQGLGVLLTVHNVTADGFDRATAHTLLTDPAARARAVESILAEVRGRYAGVNLDLENLHPGDRQAYTAFVRAVADRLRPEGYLVTVAVPAKTADRPWDAWSGAFDYAALGQAADRVVVMAYDEHWPGSRPGPVASLEWVERVARYAVDAIPARKILLGIPAYGYDWPDRGGARGLTSTGAARLAARAGAAIRWDAAAQVPYFHYWDAGGIRHTVYYENASSMAAKVDLVRRLGLGGIALWRLGSEDPAAWLGVIIGKLRF